MWRKKGGETMRSALYMFRHKQRLSQEEMAEIMGCSRVTYSNIETGKSNGRLKFWEALKKAFSLTDVELIKLMKNDKQKGK